MSWNGKFFLPWNHPGMAWAKKVTLNHLEGIIIQNDVLRILLIRRLPSPELTANAPENRPKTKRKVHRLPSLSIFRCKLPFSFRELFLPPKKNTASRWRPSDDETCFGRVYLPLGIRSLTERQWMSWSCWCVVHHRNETQVVFRFHETILSFGEPGSLGCLKITVKIAGFEMVQRDISRFQ